MHTDVVQAGIPAKDGCPILTRIKAFLVYEGHCATLETTLRDRQGRPVNLAEVVVSESESVSTSQHVAGDIVVRIKEMVGCASGPSKVYELTGELTDDVNGTVRVPLTTDIVNRAGIYQLNWAFMENGRPVLINEGLLSVERSLFGGLDSPKHVTGPPTINELRMHIMDSSGAENLLLDDVEFGDEQIAMALIKPIEYFNEINPPILQRYTTHNFPWRSHWLDAATGYLMQFAAHNYRRNRLAINSGGTNIDDQNKEKEYLVASKLMLDQWKDFAAMKKLALNMQACTGSIGSAYGSY